MNYSRFTFRAEIDWIEFDIQLTETTHVSALLNRSSSIKFFAPIDGPGNCTASRFKCRLQNPKSWDDVQSEMDAIAADLPFAAEPTITGIEIAFDAYSKTHNKVELAEMAAHFYRFAENLPRGNLRFGVANAKSFVLFSKFAMVENPEAPVSRQITDCYEMDFLDIRGCLAAGHTLYVGNQRPFKSRYASSVTPADADSLRIYVKTTDDGGKVTLAPQDQRARMERPLQGTALPFTTVAEARRYDFSKLAKLFKFRQFDDAKMSAIVKSSPIRVVREWQLKRLTERKLQVGQRVRRQISKKDGGGTREHAVFTKADQKLNKRAAENLRSLTARMKKPTRRSERAKSPVVDFCGEMSHVITDPSDVLATPAITPAGELVCHAKPAPERLGESSPILPASNSTAVQSGWARTAEREYVIT